MLSIFPRLNPALWCPFESQARSEELSVENDSGAWVSLRIGRSFSLGMAFWDDAIIYNIQSINGILLVPITGITWTITVVMGN